MRNRHQKPGGAEVEVSACQVAGRNLTRVE
jgi:hypothetical protein